MPIISRDAIKEGYVNTYGIKHNQLPPDTNAIVSKLFFAIVNQHLTGKVSTVIEAAFQHKIWAARFSEILSLSNPFIIVCSLDAMLAARRHLHRGLEDPRREFFHGDRRVAIYKETGVLSPPANYSAPKLAAPTIKVSTDGEYEPSIDEITNMIRVMDAQQANAPDAVSRRK